MRTIEPLVGTRAEVEVVAATDAGSIVAEDAIVREVERLEDIFTIFRPSELQRFRDAGTTDVPELLEVVELAASWHRRSGGAFHPGAQPLVDLWDAAEQAGKLPDEQLLAATVARLDPTGGSTLNLNAIAKGWIAERAVASTFELGLDPLESGWLSLGGDIVHRGSNPLTVGIENPHRPYDNEAPLATIELSNEALATSGGARRFWTIEGQRFPKILNPRTGQPTRALASSTIVARDAATADVLATIALLIPEPELLTLAAEASAVCLLVSNDGTVTSSSERFEVHNSSR